MNDNIISIKSIYVCWTHTHTQTHRCWLFFYYYYYDSIPFRLGSIMFLFRNDKCLCNKPWNGVNKFEPESERLAQCTREMPNNHSRTELTVFHPGSYNLRVSTGFYYYYYLSSHMFFFSFPRCYFWNNAECNLSAHFLDFVLQQQQKQQQHQSHIIYESHTWMRDEERHIFKQLLSINVLTIALFWYYTVHYIKLLKRNII